MLCKCGCGKQIGPLALKGYCKGHHGRGKYFSENSKRKMSQSHKGQKSWNEGKTLSKTHKENLSKSHKFTIKQIKIKYPFFSQVEEMRYNPDKFKEKEIQVHCKNHNCKNSKENGGWFTPSYSQFIYRICALEHLDGNDGAYIYCSEQCKQSCDIYYFQTHKGKERSISYTEEEYQTFRQFVLERDNYICQFCEEKPATDVHHERPQKLDEFFSLDPDYAWSCCEECHYKYGHKTGTECSTGNLAYKIC